MFYSDLIQDTIMPLGLDMTQENDMAELLAKQELFGTYFYKKNSTPLINLIKRNDLNGFCFLLLNRTNRLTFNSQELKHDLLWEFCILQHSSERFRMIITLFDPNKFGGLFFYTDEEFPDLFTDLGRINRRPMVPTSGPWRPV